MTLFSTSGLTGSWRMCLLQIRILRWKICNYGLRIFHQNLILDYLYAVLSYCKFDCLFWCWFVICTVDCAFCRKLYSSGCNDVITSLSANWNSWSKRYYNSAFLFLFFARRSSIFAFCCVIKKISCLIQKIHKMGIGSIGAKKNRNVVVILQTIYSVAICMYKCVYLFS